MEGVAAGAATPRAEDRGQHHDGLVLPRTPAGPPASATLASGHQDGDQASDATESADSDSEDESSWSSGHDGEEDSTTQPFMKAYVDKVFHGRDDFEQEEKARFGALCSGPTARGRDWFAKYVSAQRCHSKCVSEATFYRLVQSFAVVLFECYQLDDYGPAKNLMTMCFTYYYHGRLRPSPSELLEPGAPGPGLQSASKPYVRGFFGGLESKLRSSMATKPAGGGGVPETKAALTGCDPAEEERVEKVYLYTHLKQQPIWHTLRFWNAAFFDAVHCERRKSSPTTREKWCHMTQEEKDDSYRTDENITFGQLGTFTHNMLAFGLSKKLCRDFLKKQAVIGSLNEEQFKLLTEHIEKMAAAN